jgi:hypothetical protein
MELMSERNTDVYQYLGEYLEDDLIRRLAGWTHRLDNRQ